MQIRKAKARRRELFFAVGFACFIAVAVGPTARAQDPPHYKVDASWPKEFPNNWILGRVGGIAVDKDDHIWVLQSPTFVLGDAAAAAQAPPLYECCRPAPAVLEFDSDGKVLRSWGGRGYVPDWPSNEIGLDVDHEGNIWMGGEFGLPVSLPNGIPGFGGDIQVLKFSPYGKLLLENCHRTLAPANNQDTTILGAPGRMTVDEAAHEVYIA